jgi:hypothetical protein
VAAAKYVVGGLFAIETENIATILRDKSVFAVTKLALLSDEEKTIACN